MDTEMESTERKKRLSERLKKLSSMHPSSEPSETYQKVKVNEKSCIMSLHMMIESGDEDEGIEPE